MNKPIVSVIIPAFNRMGYIDETIKSVLNQTYKNVQLLVIDDGSTDGTYEKIKSYGDKLTLLTHNGHANKGQSAAINLGLAGAIGEYIAILDSDDYWELNKLEIQVNFLDKHKDIGLVYTNGYAVDAKGNKIYPIYNKFHIETNEPDAVLLDCYIALPVNSLVRREIYNQVGEFNESFRAAQDHDMLIRIAEVAKFAYLPDYLWYYRRHGDSISSNQQNLRWNYGYTILKNAKKRYPYKSITIKKRRAVLNYRMAMYYVENHQYIRSVWYFITAFVFDPVRAIKVSTDYEKRN